MDELTHLCDLMVSLSRAGIPLDKGLVRLGAELPGRMAAVTGEMSQRLESGASLAEIVSPDGSPFPQVYASVVEAGLRSGRTTVALEGFARLARQIAEIRRLVASSLVYPVIVLVLLSFISLNLFPVLVPTLTGFFEERFSSDGQATSLPTVLAVWALIAPWFWVLPAILLVLAIFWFVATRRATAAQPSEFSDWVRWVPGARRLLRYSRLLAFTEVLRLLVDQQVPLHQAVMLAGSASGDRDLQSDGARLATQLERGEHPTDAGSIKRGIPPFLRWGICNSQKFGQLQSTLERSAQTYQRRTEDSAFRMRTFLPVAFSLLLGGILTACYVMMFYLPWMTILRSMAEPLRLI